MPKPNHVPMFSVQDGTELYHALTRQVPAKIDIGPIYNVDPRRRTAYAGILTSTFTCCSHHNNSNLRNQSQPHHGIYLCMHMTTGQGTDNSFQPRQRELVFDIDLTDYDDVRTCGSGGHICNQCWPLMAVAVQVQISPSSCTHVHPHDSISMPVIAARLQACRMP